jgi:hypothetical protein
VDRYARGAELWARGQPFEAHEVWEDLWRETAPRSRERALLAGLIQACAATLQARKQKWDGVARLIERACGNLAAAGVPEFAAVLRQWGGRGDPPALPGNLWPPPASKQS